MPKPRARCATSWPIRPKPSTPSVFSYSSTPESFERSHLPSISDACARGMLRASASSSAIVCSAAVTTLDSGAFATTMPRLVAAGTSTLSTPTPARPITLSRSAALDQLGRHLRGRADQDAVVLADPLDELGVVPVDAEIDVEVRAQQLDTRVADLLLDEDPRACAFALRCRLLRRRRAHRPLLSTIQSMHPVSASTSAVSTAGNMPIRSWLRPSLR